MKTRKKFKPVLIVSLTVFVFICASMFYLITYNHNNSFSSSNSLDAINKVRGAEASGSTVELTSNEVNEIYSIYLKNGKTKGSITLTGVTTTISDNALTTNLFIKYKNFNLLLSSKGNISYENEEILYKPSWFKIGKLPINTSIIMNLALKYSNEDFKITNNCFEISKKNFPFKINNLSVNDNKLVLSLEKFSTSSLFASLTDSNLNTVPKNNNDEQQKSAINQTISSVKQEEKVIAQAGSSDTSSTNTYNSTSQASSSESQPSATNTSNQSSSVASNQQTNTKAAALNKVSVQLSAALSSVNSAGGKEVISIMINTVNTLAVNPSYNYSSDVTAVKSKYVALTQEERDSIKIALLSNVDLQTALELRNAFGI